MLVSSVVVAAATQVFKCELWLQIYVDSLDHSLKICKYISFIVNTIGTQILHTQLFFSYD